MGHERKPVVAVIGATGGVGTSSFACALAVSSRAGLLVDLDTCGGGLDTMLGVEAVRGTRWSGMRAAGGVIDPVDLSRGLPRWRGIALLAADGAAPRPEAVVAVLDAGRLLGPVIVDGGRCLCAESTFVLKQCDVVLIVAEAELRGVAAVRAAASRLEGTTLGLVVRRGSLPRAEVQALTSVQVRGTLTPLGRRSRLRMHRSLLRVAAGIVRGIDEVSAERTPAGTR